MEYQKYIDWQRNNWDKSWAPITIFPTVYYGATYAFVYVFGDLNNPTVVNHFWELKNGTAFILALGACIFWLHSRKYPTKNTDVIGIAIAVRENTSQAKEIKDDVIEKFQEIITSTDNQTKIELTLLPDRLAKKVVDEKTARYALGKTKTHFIIWGKSRKYTDQYEFDLNYVVRHKTLEDKQQQVMKKSFTDVLSEKEWRFLEGEALPAIHATADNMREIALYVIGVASQLSGDTLTSINLHKQLHDILVADPAKKKGFDAIFLKTKGWLSRAHIDRSTNQYFDNNIEGATEENALALSYQPDSYAGILQNALLSFTNGNVENSKKSLRRIAKMNGKGKIKDAAWRYSKAFLLLIEENYRSAWKEYRKALASGTAIFTDASVIDFNTKYLEKDNSQVGLFMINGVIYQDKFENYTLALEQFEHFIRRSEGLPEYDNYRAIATGRLREVYNELELSKNDRLV